MSKTHIHLIVVIRIKIYFHTLNENKLLYLDRPRALSVAIIVFPPQMAQKTFFKHLYDMECTSLLELKFQNTKKKGALI